MQINKRLFKNITANAAVVAVIFVSGVVVSQQINLRSLTPAIAQTPNTTSYEDQSIQAVRSIKPSVVDIVGSDSSGTTINGTGFVINSDGLVVSNNHVVNDPNIKYSVVLSDGTQYDAKVLGLDAYNDVALLQIDAHGLPAVKFGDSDGLETGQTVFAVGNSLGKYQNTVTKGVVSGLGRAVDMGSNTVLQPRMQNLIQTDAAINPGNSGGPLINLKGEVVGMNTMIDAEGRGIGFAVAANVVNSSVDQLRRFGKVSKVYVGVSFVTISRPVQLLKDLKIGNGAYIDKVMPGSPAEKAGIMAGDVITQINHEKLSLYNELDSVISRYQAGNQVLVTLDRNGKQEDLPVILGQYAQQ
jgi:serine protease Do